MFYGDMKGDNSVRQPDPQNYVLDDRRVKDHPHQRRDQQSRKRAFDPPGELDPFIDAELRRRQNREKKRLSFIGIDR